MPAVSTKKTGRNANITGAALKKTNDTTKKAFGGSGLDPLNPKANFTLKKLVSAGMEYHLEYGSKGFQAFVRCPTDESGKLDVQHCAPEQIRNVSVDEIKPVFAATNLKKVLMKPKDEETKGKEDTIRKECLSHIPDECLEDVKREKPIKTIGFSMARIRAFIAELDKHPTDFESGGSLADFDKFGREHFRVHAIKTMHVLKDMIKTLSDPDTPTLDQKKEVIRSGVSHWLFVRLMKADFPLTPEGESIKWIDYYFPKNTKKSFFVSYAEAISATSAELFPEARVLKVLLGDPGIATALLKTQDKETTLTVIPIDPTLYEGKFIRLLNTTIRMPCPIVKGREGVPLSEGSAATKDVQSMIVHYISQISKVKHGVWIDALGRADDFATAIPGFGDMKDLLFKNGKEEGMRSSMMRRIFKTEVVKDGVDLRAPEEGDAAASILNLKEEILKSLTGNPSIIKIGGRKISLTGRTVRTEMEDRMLVSVPLPTFNMTDWSEIPTVAEAIIEVREVPGLKAVSTDALKNVEKKKGASAKTLKFPRVAEKVFDNWINEYDLEEGDLLKFKQKIHKFDSQIRWIMIMLLNQNLKNSGYTDPAEEEDDMTDRGMNRYDKVLDLTSTD